MNIGVRKEVRPPPHDPQPSAPPNLQFCSGSHAWQQQSGDASPPVFMSACLQAFVLFNSRVCKSSCDGSRGWIGDLKMKQRVFVGTTLTDWLTDRWWTTRSRPHSAGEAIWFCWSSPQSPNSSGSQTLARGSGMCCKHCTLLYAEAGSYSVRKAWEQIHCKIDLLSINCKSLIP